MNQNNHITNNIYPNKNNEPIYPVADAAIGPFFLLLGLAGLIRITIDLINAYPTY